MTTNQIVFRFDCCVPLSCIFLSFNLSIYLSIYLSIFITIYLYNCLSIHLPGVEDGMVPVVAVGTRPDLEHAWRNMPEQYHLEGGTDLFNLTLSPLSKTRIPLSTDPAPYI